MESLAKIAYYAYNMHRKDSEVGFTFQPWEELPEHIRQAWGHVVDTIMDDNSEEEDGDEEFDDED